MTQTQRLLDRLDSIGASLARRRHTLALLGLGSVGKELERLDEFSDLDFFVIVEAGHQSEFIDDLSWLTDCAPLAFSFRNTPHGHKALFEDGIYAEFAVFAPEELSIIPFEPGRVVWHAAGFESTALPEHVGAPAEAPPLEWSLNEALTNLYVGLLRFRRGEHLAGYRLVQVHAIDRLLEVIGRIASPWQTHPDTFDSTRRLEQRFPGIGTKLRSFMLGYERTPESALAILGFLEAHFSVDSNLQAAIAREAGAAAAQTASDFACDSGASCNDN